MIALAEAGFLMMIYPESQPSQWDANSRWDAALGILEEEGGDQLSDAPTDEPLGHIDISLRVGGDAMRAIEFAGMDQGVGVVGPAR